MPDDIDKIIEALEVDWAQEERDQKAREAEAQKEHLVKLRDGLMKGTFKPRHRCPQCLRAILTMSPETCCEAGKTQHGQWWRRA